MMGRLSIPFLVCLLAAPAGANIEPILETSQEELGYEPWQSFYGLVKTWVPYYGKLTLHDDGLYVVDRTDILRLDPRTGGGEPWLCLAEPDTSYRILGICFHGGDFWFSGDIRSGRSIHDWTKFLFQRVGGGWAYRGEYAGPLASDGENLYAARECVVGVWRERDFHLLTDLGDEYWVTDLTWDGESLWAAVAHYFDADLTGYLFRIDAGTGEVTGWLPLPWIAYSVWTFERSIEFTHLTVASGLAADSGRLFLVAEDALWKTDPAAVCTEELPEAIGYCPDGVTVCDSPGGGEAGELRARDPVYCLGEEDGWWRVYTPLGVVGWVRADAVFEGTSVRMDPPD